ncbi:hypothetical protein SAMN02910265_00205 [Ruminococcus flavefaciens]|uniref:Uncharacterized protein n=1 Tax=Ruminococcus flavefaciens TaxID=1265 RepID=A0A1H6HQL6_RUMFL|nr:hypothetical protein [Ruminococcus flavefaciens]SEH38135.1 hypothetical protein SAMN02910265_00205 [Ruminococcus flavefaciens]
MKNDHEMYQSVLSKRNEHRLRKERRIRIIKRTVPVLACFILTVVLVLGWKNIDKMPIIPSDPEIIDVTAITTSEASTSSITGNVSTVTTSAAETKAAQTQKNTDSTTHSSTSVNTTYLAAQTYAQNTVQTIHTTAAMTQLSTTVVTKETAKQTALTEIQTTAVTTSVTTKFGGFGGDDMAFHTLPQSITTVSKTTLTTITSVTTTTDNSGNDGVPTKPMNEEYPIGIFDGDMTMYRNTYRISPDDVGDYIDTVGMRGLPGIYKAKAYKIKNIDQTIAIAVKFEEDEGYYLYRNNDTTIDTIKELISPTE